MLNLFKRHKNLGAILIVSGIVITIFSTFAWVIPSLIKPPTQLWLGDGIFRAKLATTVAAREQGLSGVMSLEKDQALLMVFSKSDKWGIWMKDMNVPIDIVWLDANKRVIYRVKNATPDLGESRTFQPTKPAKYVVELPAGTIDSKHISNGAVALFTIDAAEKVE